MSNPEPRPLPEIRQCQDPNDFAFGASAVKGDGKWGVMDPVNGGYWATDDNVASWEVVVPDGTLPPDLSNELPEGEAAVAADFGGGGELAGEPDESEETA